MEKHHQHRKGFVPIEWDRGEGRIRDAGRGGLRASGPANEVLLRILAPEDSNFNLSAIM